MICDKCLHADVCGDGGLFEEALTCADYIGWISVSEKLPEFSKEVLTCNNGGFIEIQSLENLNNAYWENQSGDWTDFDEVIAWMPLPKSFEPQEDKEEENDV